MIRDSWFDVIVLGSGVAGLTSAICARESGADVLVLEKAPKSWRGGNGRFTEGTIRFAYDEELHGFPPYPASRLYADLLKESQGKGDPQLLRVLAYNSREAILWLEEHGVESWGPENMPFDMKNTGSFHYIAKGEGRGLVDGLLKVAQGKGITVAFNARAVKLQTDSAGRVHGVKVSRGSRAQRLRCGAIILACGGFESSRTMRVKYIGKQAGNLIVRGTKYNTGDGLRMALDVGAVPYGDWGDFHSGVSDARAPRVGGGLFQIAGFPFTIIVNKRGERFFDEGENFYDVTYVKVGKALLKQPGRIGYCIFDSKAMDYVTSYSARGPYKANSIRKLASRCKLRPGALERTMDEFNAAVLPGDFNPHILDGKRTERILPPKSNWALTIDTPPFFAYPITGSITFTFGGLKVDEEARVARSDGSHTPGLYAVGEITGGFYYYNYLGSTGITRNLVFGRIAGKSAALEGIARRERGHKR